ncbi:hypothetical protein L6452_36741 [Arctium lappa]|uniref:Uncharacterized protein n=1 Tax=Arctium lappa TaxID=4217 RepID=A0ACB8Y129_ARCLA|nr:hypothetical protein L6452_36741 [Arctium lappa]
MVVWWSQKGESTLVGEVVVADGKGFATAANVSSGDGDDGYWCSPAMDAPVVEWDEFEDEEWVDERRLMGSVKSDDGAGGSLEEEEEE